MRGLPQFEAVTFTRSAMLSLDNFAQIARGFFGVSPPIRGCNFRPICNVALAIRVGPKGPHCWPQATAGDYKGAQPPYLADKRPEGALSASVIQNVLYNDRLKNGIKT